jgi:hypothetical protein
MGGEESVRVQLTCVREARCGWTMVCCAATLVCEKKTQKSWRHVTNTHARTFLTTR